MIKRTDIWNSLKTDPSCDVLILGGGINGTSLMRDLALQGVNSVLVDKDDFTAGASSKSSRMIHGGLRYLENAEFKLVKEAVIERNRLLKYAPQYVGPLKTSIPIDSWFAGLIKSPMVFLRLPVSVGGRGAFIVKMGLSFYDLITIGRRQTPCHYLLSKEKSLKEIPGLRQNIACTATYWDAWISQAERLCIEMIEEATIENSSSRAINYVSAQKSGPDSVTITDSSTGEQITLKPKIVVNATGAWVDYANKSMGVDSQFMGGTKGSHLVIDNKELYDALGDRMVYYEHSDGRICIVFRFMDKIIMGSTDIRVENPDDAECTEDEVEYMISSLKGVFPHLTISKNDTVFKFCGVRPLPASGMDYTSRVSRSHRLAVSEPDSDRKFKIYSMIGGKLTTFRTFAEETADKILTTLQKTRKISTEDRCYLGATGFPTDDSSKKAWIDRVAKANNLSEDRVANLLERYGTLAEKIAPTDNTPLENLSDYSIGEIEYIAENECIRHLSDLVRRRSIITILGKSSESVLAELASIVGKVLGWDQSRCDEEVKIALTEATDGR